MEEGLLRGEASASHMAAATVLMAPRNRKSGEPGNMSGVQSRGREAGSAKGWE